MIDPFWSVVIALGGIASGLAGVLAAIYKSKKDSKNAESITKAALDARIDARVDTQLAKAYEEIDTLKEKVETLETVERRRAGAFTRIFRDLARQWTGSTAPRLNPADIAEVEETIPPNWIGKPTEIH